MIMFKQIGSVKFNSSFVDKLMYLYKLSSKFIEK